MRLTIFPLFLLAALPALGQPGPCASNNGSVTGSMLDSLYQGNYTFVSEILTPYSQTVVSYSATELGAYAAYYYQPSVEAALYQGNSLVAYSGWNSGPPGNEYNVVLVAQELTAPSWLSAETYTNVQYGAISRGTTNNACYPRTTARITKPVTTTRLTWPKPGTTS